MQVVFPGTKQDEILTSRTQHSSVSVTTMDVFLNIHRSTRCLLHFVRGRSTSVCMSQIRTTFGSVELGVEREGEAGKWPSYACNTPRLAQVPRNYQYLAGICLLLLTATYRTYRPFLLRNYEAWREIKKSQRLMIRGHWDLPVAYLGYSLPRNPTLIHLPHLDQLL